MEDKFKERFAAGSDMINAANLLSTHQKDDEDVLNYITRWPNLSIKCDQAIDPSQAIGVLIENIHHPMAPFAQPTSTTMKTWSRKLNACKGWNQPLTSFTHPNPKSMKVGKRGLSYNKCSLHSTTRPRKEIYSRVQIEAHLGRRQRKTIAGRKDKPSLLL